MVGPLALLVLYLGTASTWSLLPSPPLRRGPIASSPQHALRGDPRCTASRGQEPFNLKIDLGDGSGIVEHSLQPFFTKSSLVTVRVPLPFQLQADPIQGAFKVVEDGYGLRIGDVLRACSTLALRYDSAARTSRVGPGLPGKALEASGSAASATAMPQWLSAFQSNWNPLTAFAEQRPTKCLFIADGQPHSVVTDALVANEVGKVREIVLVFERPLE